MFSPPLALQPIVAEGKDPATGGVLLLAADGSVYAFGGARYKGGPNGKPYFVGRKAAQFFFTPEGDYGVVAESGERYGPGF